MSAAEVLPSTSATSSDAFATQPVVQMQARLEDHGPYAAQYLSNVRENHPELLKLEYIGRNFGDNDAANLAEALTGNTHIQRLHFSDNALTDVGLDHLAKALNNNSTISALILENNKIGDDAAKGLLQCMRRHNHTLTEVNLNGNAISKELLADLEGACIMNQQPEILKKGLVGMLDDTLAELDLSTGNNAKPFTDISTQLLADALKVNTSLTKLNFSHNNPGDGRTVMLAKAMEVNQTLRELYLQSNNISCIGLISLAEALKVNTSLVEIDFRNNIVSDAGADTLIQTLTTNNTVAQIHLSLNNINRSKMELLVHGLMLNAQPKYLKAALPTIQANSAGVRKIESRDDELKMNDVTCRVLLNAMRNNTFITVVNLSGQAITCEGANCLAMLLQVNSTIVELYLTNNKIGDKGASDLLQALVDNHSLKILDLEGNKVSKDLMTRLSLAVELNSEPLSFKKRAPMLLDNDPGLTIMDFSAGDTNRCTTKTVQLLCDVLENNTSLKELSLANCSDVSMSGFKLVASLLARSACPGLTALDVSSNSLGDEGAIHFARMLASNSSLLELSLKDNGITSATDFVAALGSHNNSLTTLELSGNDLPLADLRDIDLLTRLNTQSDTFKESVIKLFANTPELTELDLCEYEKRGECQYQYRRRYNDSSVALLSEALKSNSVLTSLNLAGNSITDVGAATLADMVLENKSLTTINLNSNQIGDQGFLILAKALTSNNTISMVSSEANPIHPDTRKKLNHATHSFTAAKGQSYDGAQNKALDEHEIAKHLEEQILADALTDSNLLMTTSTRQAIMNYDG